MISAHTPLRIEDQGDAGLVILDHNGNFYARTYSWVDARLIAAAPALLVALEEALAFVEGREYSVRLREKARAAIAQAKGANK